MPTAIEEFLRAYAPVTMAREVVKETEINGCTFKPGRDGAAVVPGRQPRSRNVPGRRQGDHRPQGEPPRRVRPRHPPLRRLEPGAHGDDGGGGGTAEAHPRVQPRRRGDLVGGHRARAAQAADQVQPAERQAACAPRPPVTDWATDWDHLDPRWVEDPFPIWDELRQTCPIAHTERFKGVYLPTRYEDVRAIAYDPEHFSSRKVVVREVHAATGAAPRRSPPTRHGTALARMVLLPPFTPQGHRKL